VSNGRGTSWALLGVLAALTLGSAVWSVSTSPTSSNATTSSLGHRLALTPSTIVLGQQFRLSGTDCPPKDHVVTGNARVTPKSDGSWSVLVKASLPVGTTQVRAECVSAGGRSKTFTYSPVSLRVSTSPPAGTELTVSPRDVAIGDSIRITGTGCFPNDYVIPDYGATVTPKSDGSWSSVGTIDDGSPVGNVEVGALCVMRADKATVFDYQGVTIHINTYRHLSVSPRTTIGAGAAMTVSSVGPCPNILGDEAELELEYPGDPASAVPIGSAALSPSTGEWSTTIRIPPTAFGKYLLLATCIVPRLFVAYYSSLRITVTGAR